MGKDTGQEQAMPKVVADTVAHYLRGLGPVEIAAEMGVSYKAIWERLRRPDAQAKLLEIQADQFKAAAGLMKRTTGEAVDTLIAVMRGPAADQSRMAATAILDRAGLGPTQKHEIEHDQVMELVINGERLEMPRGPPPAPILTEPDG